MSGSQSLLAGMRRTLRLLKSEGSHVILTSVHSCNGTQASKHCRLISRIRRRSRSRGRNVLGSRKDKQGSSWAPRRLLPPAPALQKSLGPQRLAAPILFMVALCNRADHYIFALWFLSFFFFFSSPNLSGRRLDVYHTSTDGVALVRI